MPKLAAASFATAAIALLVAAPAQAARGDGVIKDCTADGRMDGGWSQADYKDALDNLPTDIDEYTDCRELIRAAQLAARRGGGGGSRAGGGGGAAAARGAEPPAAPAAPTAGERVRIERARKGGPVRVGGTHVAPGESGGPLGEPAAATNRLPLPLLLALLALAASGLALTAAAVRR